MTKPGGESAEAILEALAKSAEDFVVVRLRLDRSVPAGWVIEFASDSMSKIMGVAPDEPMSALFERMHPEDVPRVLEAGQNALVPGTKFDLVLRLRDPSDESRWRHIHCISNAEVGESGEVTHHTGTMIDITDARRAAAEREELEARVRRARELEALGTLVGGVAHDFNNLLMAIQGCVSLARIKLGDDRHQISAVTRLLREAEHHVSEGAELTAQLLGCARTDQKDLRPLCLTDLARDVTKTFARTHKQLKVRSKLPSEPIMVRADQAQLNRALLNLLLNAADAMNAHGAIDVGVTIEADPRPVLEAGGESGDWAVVTVRDEGHGMEPGVVARIFEPFFSTKPRDEGTGLGLAAVYGIARSHGGYVDVSSEPGRGSAFWVYLPLATPATPSKPIVYKEPLRGTGTVLVVDDEPSVLAVLAAMLEELGYRALKASSGERALEIYREQGGEVDLVVLDLVMPGMNGGQVYQRLIDIDANVRVAFASGYRDSGSWPQMPAAAAAVVIAKPFRLDELADAISEALA